MKNYGSYLVAMALFVSGFARAGAERGGGTSPRPIFMTEDTAYECSVKNTQMSKKVQRALVSRATESFSWKKGEYAGNRGIDLKDIKNWKHTELHMGPGRPIEKEVALPQGAIFNGHLRFSIYMGNINLYAVTVSTDGKTDAKAESFDSKVLGSKDTLSTRVKQTVENRSTGGFVEQATLEVSCKRVQ